MTAGFRFPVEVGHERTTRFHPVLQFEQIVFALADEHQGRNGRFAFPYLFVPGDGVFVEQGNITPHSFLRELFFEFEYPVIKYFQCIPALFAVFV